MSSVIAKDFKMMHIAFCLDNHYVQYCVTTIVSVIANNSDADITFHLFVDGISDENREKLQAWIGQYNGKSVLFYDLSEEDFKDFPMGDSYINLTTYFRLVIPDKLPDIDKVLYLAYIFHTHPKRFRYEKFCSPNRLK